MIGITRFYIFLRGAVNYLYHSGELGYKLTAPSKHARIEIFCLQTRDSDRVANPVNYAKLNAPGIYNFIE